MSNLQGGTIVKVLLIGTVLFAIYYLLEKNIKRAVLCLLACFFEIFMGEQFSFENPDEGKATDAQIEGDVEEDGEQIDQSIEMEFNEEQPEKVERILALEDEQGFVFWDSNARYLTLEEVKNLQYADSQFTYQELLAFARNEIYARHGQRFHKPININYYTQFGWYNRLQKVDEVSRNEYEIYNVDLIVKVEDENGFPH